MKKIVLAPMVKERPQANLTVWWILVVALGIAMFTMVGYACKRVVEYDNYISYQKV